MSSFESGVKGYVLAVANIYMQFPIDHKGNEHVCCEQCWYYRTSSRVCGLTKKPVMMPDKYVGDECPFMPIEEEEASGTEIQNSGTK